MNHLWCIPRAISQHLNAFCCQVYHGKRELQILSFAFKWSESSYRCYFLAINVFEIVSEVKGLVNLESSLCINSHVYRIGKNAHLLLIVGYNYCMFIISWTLGRLPGCA